MNVKSLFNFSNTSASTSIGIQAGSSNQSVCDVRGMRARASLTRIELSQFSRESTRSEARRRAEPRRSAVQVGRNRVVESIGRESTLGEASCPWNPTAACVYRSAFHVAPYQTTRLSDVAACRFSRIDA